MEGAERAAGKAVRGLERGGGGEVEARGVELAAVNLLGEIAVEKGDVSGAVGYFHRAVALDPDGAVPESAGGGAEKFLWLAQLSEVGGRDSVGWFEKGAEVLRREIARSGGEMEMEVETSEGVARMDINGVDGANGDSGGSPGVRGLQEKRKKLASALCGIVEVYMTDLSWEEDAETVCERCVAEALMVAPGVPEPLQTLASIRISQGRLDEARKALQDSMALWKGDLDDGDEEDGQTRDTTAESTGAVVPDFPTRISLARLLMEVGLAEDAVEVVERLVGEDDHSVEAWYLGGWGLYLLGTTETEKEDPEVTIRHEENEQEKQKMARISSREWLRQSLKLYDMLDYEDDRLKEHASELIEELDQILGKGEEGDEDGHEDEWESDGSLEEDEDNDMKDV